MTRRVILIAYIVFLIVPIYWLINMSFKTNTEITTTMSIVPMAPTLKNYAEIFTNPTWYGGFRFSLTYVVLAQRRNAFVSIGGAMAVWILLAVMERRVHWSLTGGLIANAVAFAISLPLLRRFQHAKMPLITRRWYDVPLRAGLVATLVATVVTLSSWVGPEVSGTIALVPIVLTSMMLILHPRIGGPATAALIANGGWGLMGFGLSFVVLHIAAVPWGSAIALCLVLAVCLGWNLALWWLGRRKIAR